MTDTLQPTAYALKPRSTEWLLTNGLGGYAMGTLPGINMRRYHGLLVAAAAPPVGRVVAVHSVIDEITLDDDTSPIPLASQHFGDPPVIHPDGLRCIEDVVVELPGQIRWRLTRGDLVLIRTLRLEPGRNRITLDYEIQGGMSSRAELRLRPMVPLRDFHALADPEHPPVAAINGSTSLRVTREQPSQLAVELTITRGSFALEPDWWRNFAYLQDRDRGQPWHEDIFCPGTFTVALTPEQPSVQMTAELTLPTRVDVQPLHSRSRPLMHSPARSARARLEAAAEQFIVHRRVSEIDCTSIIAGYPWFADWGRDAMICIPGLLLCAKRFPEAERVLMAFAFYLRRGLIPNCFDDESGEPQYNSVDASLWFIHAVAELHARTPTPIDATITTKLLMACRLIVSAYRNGTDFNIKMDPADGLLAAGDADTPLTWMDAKREGIAYTPRHGKAIEVNALWHHALHRLGMLSDVHEEATHLRTLAEQVASSMQRLFWREDAQCCSDVLVAEQGNWVADTAVRPNQIFAVSLSPSPLSMTQQKAVVRTVREKLLTPFGLRTLDPAHPAYQGRYEGNLQERDAAYHQGTAWPWLIGPYCEAVLRTGQFSKEAKGEVAQVIKPLLRHLADDPVGDQDAPSGCVGQIAEVYDGDAPHRPSGCPAQAWSIAELLRVLDLLEHGERQ